MEAQSVWTSEKREQNWQATQSEEENINEHHRKIYGLLYCCYKAKSLQSNDAILTWARKSFPERVVWWNLLMRRAKNCLKTRKIPFTCRDPLPSLLGKLPEFVWPLAYTDLSASAQKIKPNYSFHYYFLYSFGQLIWVWVFQRLIQMSREQGWLKSDIIGSTKKDDGKIK